MTATDRRWFRFSLRTLFVVFTVVCCWVGYELNWIRQRHEFLAREEATVVERVWTKFQYDPLFARVLSVSRRPQEAPGLLWLFGERGHSVVTVVVEAQTTPHHTAGVTRGLLSQSSQKHIEEAERLFPESQIATMEMGDSEASGETPGILFPG